MGILEEVVDMRFARADRRMVVPGGRPWTAMAVVVRQDSPADIGSSCMAGPCLICPEQR